MAVSVALIQEEERKHSLIYYISQAFQGAKAKYPRTEKIATLNRFVPRGTDKCLPFFKTLKQAFAWTDECEAAFQELKRYLSNPPLLSPSKEGENLYLYLAVSTIAVSAALIREEERKQLPVY